MHVYEGVTALADGTCPALQTPRRAAADPALAAHVGVIDGDTSITRSTQPDVSTSETRVKAYAAWLSLAAVR